MCRSRRELSNEYLLAKIGVDTAENEPLEVWGKIQFSIHFTPYVHLLVPVARGRRRHVGPPHRGDLRPQAGRGAGLDVARDAESELRARPPVQRARPRRRRREAKHPRRAARTRKYTRVLNQYRFLIFLENSLTLGIYLESPVILTESCESLGELQSIFAEEQ